jgi:hypothetical protein
MSMKRNHATNYNGFLLQSIESSGDTASISVENLLINASRLIAPFAFKKSG